MSRGAGRAPKPKYPPLEFPAPAAMATERAGLPIVPGSALIVLEGDSLDPDAAAWAWIADTAKAALTLPGLSARCASQMVRMRAASLRAAGLPLSQPVQESQTA
jgi:hypothetical protein